MMGELGNYVVGVGLGREEGEGEESRREGTTPFLDHGNGTL